MHLERTEQDTVGSAQLELSEQGWFNRRGKWEEDLGLVAFGDLFSLWKFPHLAPAVLGFTRGCFA